MTTYTIITDDNFTRASTSAGTVTGPATYNAPSTGAAYSDLKGATWSINSNVLVAANLNSGDYSDALLLRPTSENQLNGQVAVTGTVGTAGSVMLALARYNGSQAYCVYCYGSGSSVSMAISRIGPGNGVTTTIATTGTASASIAGSTPLVLTLSVSGTSPTTLTATIAAASAPGTILATLTGTDSTSALQVAGQTGLSANQNSTGAATAQITRLTTYQAVSSLAIAQNITVSPASASVASGGQQQFSVGLDGTLNSGVTLTVTLATTTGSLSPATLTFTGTGTTVAAQTVTLTAGSGNGALSSTHGESGGTQAVNDFASVPVTVTTTTALAIGTLAASATQSGVTLSLSAPLSGGTTSGYGYRIYRGTTPAFTAAAASLLTTVTTMPYTDTTANPGVQYFYGVVANDSSGATVTAVPTGVGSWTPSYTPYVAAQLHTTALNIVFAGDSITYGYGVSNAGSVNSPTMPYFCMTKLKRLLGIRSIFGSNQGHTGHTLTDYAPGGSDYNSAKAAMTALNTANPAALPVWSLLLGTNDSAQSGSNNAPYTTSLTPVQFSTKLAALITQMLSDFPASKVFVHMPPYYSPNTHNSLTNYEQAGLNALFGYRSAIVSTVAGYARTNPGQVFVGDTTSFQYFAENYLSELQGDTSGTQGTLYIHPTGTAGSNGLIGTQTLGEMHAQAIAQALYGSVSGAAAAHATGVRGGIR